MWKSPNPKKTYDVIVVGGGGHGLGTAYYLAKEHGIKNIAVVAPGFISDCLETLEELNVEARELFIENGGQNFEYIPCLNDNKHSIKLLNQIIKTNLLGWIE